MQQNSKNKRPDCDNSAENRIDLPVLGLAGRHFGNGKLENCRYVYCTTSWMGLRWPVPSMCPRAPCIHSTKFLLTQKTKAQNKTERSFTSVQMVHTHASLPRGFCSDSQAVKAIIRSLKRKWLRNTGKNHLLN